MLDGGRRWWSYPPYWQLNARQGAHTKRAKFGAVPGLPTSCTLDSGEASIYPMYFITILQYWQSRLISVKIPSIQKGTKAHHTGGRTAMITAISMEDTYHDAQG